MPAKQSQEVRNAMKLVDEGHSMYDAAHKSGVWPSTLYRAIAARKSQKLAVTNKSKKKKIK